MIITIDGPSASGKSTLARLLAQEFNCYYLYSGLLYRALAYAALQYQIDIEHITESQGVLLMKQLIYTYNGTEQILFNHEDITTQLHTSVIDDAASRISALPHVRIALDAWQKKIVQQHNNIIVDGRDSGSVVFPHAQLKLFIDVPLDVRAQRWIIKQRGMGKQYSLEQAMELLSKRDTRDTHRVLAPLIIPAQAVVVENGGTLQETIFYIKQLIVRVSDEIQVHVPLDQYVP